MTGAMYAAVAGLKTHMSAMNVIGNNISNVNTVGYKATRYTFNEALYTSVRSGSNGTDQLGGYNPAQIGYGCSVGTIDLDMSTKNYNPTGKPLDCMIDGDGFFIVGDDKTNTGVLNQSSLQGMGLSRLGNFTFDPEGYLVDGNGQLVYGFLRITGTEELTSEDLAQIPEECLTSPVLTPIRLPLCYVSGSTGGSTKTETTIFWPRWDDAEDGIRDGSYVDLQAVGLPQKPDGSGDIDSDAYLTRLQPGTIQIDNTGCITCVTKDEKMLVIGYIGIATVDNPDGVTHVDGRYYRAMGGAGNVHLTTIGGRLTNIGGSTPPSPPTASLSAAGQAWAGNTDLYNTDWLHTSNITVEAAGDTELVNGGLESSGTDLAQEISNMIMIQRGYQANTRIVTVTDSMLEELVNMKRG